ncbi:MAG: Hsp70 family protein, partial [Oscillospiraceae bacterium]|nr:Hsp70 family protein [Oscillospiraceae bacterium]
VGTLGNHKLGGKDWDNELQKILMEKIREGTGIDLKEDAQMKYVIAQMAETVKRKLTDMTKYTVKINVPDYGRYEVEITRDEFEQKTSALLEQTKSLCAKMLEDCHYSWNDVTDVLLVGGSTRMPQVSEFLEKIIHKKPLCKVNPDEAVAIGAAIQVNLPKPKYHVLSVTEEEPETEQKKSLFSAPIFRKKTPDANPALSAAPPSGKGTSGALQVFSEDVVAHALGVLAVNKESTAYINKTIIPANQVIPVKYAESFHFYTSPDKDNTLDIFMLQGTEPPLRAKIVGNCRYVASGIRHNPDKNPTLIRIQYSYDANGMVHVQVRQEDDDYDLPIQKMDLPPDIEKYGKPIDQKDMPSVHEPVSVMMAIDVSGSMAGSPINNAKKAMMHFVQQLQDYSGSSKVGIITVSDASEIIELPTDSAHVLENKIQSVSVGRNGYGNGAHPFREIKKSLSNCKGRKIGIVLADGVWSYQDRAIQAAKECHQMGIDIVGVGFGSADEKFLKSISNGNIKSIMTSQDKLVRSFGSIAQEIGGKEGKQKNSGKRKPTATWRATDEE